MSTDLSEVEIALRDSLDAIEAHANAVWDNQQRLQAHELAISEESKTAANKTDKEWAAAHSLQAHQHERLTEAHERIKKHHHGMVAAAERLLNKISNPL